MTEASNIFHVSGSTTTLLQVPLLGKLDNSGFYVDPTGPTRTAVTLMIEIKKTGAWLLRRRRRRSAPPNQGRPPPAAAT